MEFQLQSVCLSYIHLANGLCYTNLAYPKETYILYTIDIWNNIIILESSIMFNITYMLWDEEVWEEISLYIMKNIILLVYSKIERRHMT